MTTPLPLESSDPRLPEAIGPYRLLDQLGEGASSVVYKAYHEESPTQQVAVKLTKGLWDEADIETRVRFEHEADLLSRLSHDNIIRLYRFGVHGGRLYLVMDLAPGRALSKLVSGREILKISDIVSILRQTAEALGHAHGKGILHRDIKPSNLVVAMGNGDARVKVLDFGLSRLQGHGGGSGTVGTFLYMSPEQLGILPQGTDERSDLYSLGMMGVELLNGGHPFAGRTLRELIHSHAAVIPEMAPDTPEGLKAILLGCVKKDPAERYGSARSLAKDLEVLEERLKRGETGSFALHMGDVGSKLGLPRFLGREKEAEALRGMYEHAKEGKRAVCVLSGESGVGKSRLLGEAALGWTKSVVLWGRGREYGQATGYGLLAELLRCVKVETLPEGVAERVRNVVQDRGEDLLRLVPELKPLLNGKMDTTDLAPERRQQRFGRVVVDVLQTLGTAEAPLVVVMDDIQWGDEGSLRLMRRFLEDEKTGGVLGVFAYRVEEKGLGEEARGFVAGVCGIDGSQRMELGALGGKEIEGIVESMLGGKLAEVTAAVAEEAEGNPLYAVEYMRSLTETGAVAGGGKEGWRLVDAEGLKKGGGGVTGKIAGRVEQMGEEDRSILELAAVMGSPFDFELLTAAVGMQGGMEKEEAGRRVAAGLEVLVRGRLVEGTAVGGRYVFVHNKVREAILERLEANRRRELHRWVGLAIEGEKGVGDRVFDLAHHFESAGDAERAIEYGIQAGDLSQDRYAHRESLTFYGQAERRLEMNPGLTLKAEWERRIWEREGDGERMLGRYEEAMGHYERVMGLMAGADDRIRLKTKMGRTLFSRGEHRRAAEVLEEALELAGDRIPRSGVGLMLSLIRELAIQVWHTYRPRTGPPSGNSNHRLLGKLYDELAHVYYFTNKAKAIHIQLRHLNFAERVQIPEVIAQAYCNHGPACAIFGMINRGVRYIEKSIAIRQKLADRWGIAQSQSYLSATVFPALRLREAIRYAQAAEPVFEELGDQWELVTLYLSMASPMIVNGEWGRAEAYLDRVYRLSSASKNISSMALVVRCRAELVGRIDPRKILEEAQSLLPACITAGDHTAVLGLYYACGVAYSHLECLEEAERAFHEFLAYVRRYSVVRASRFPICFLLSELLVSRARHSTDPSIRRRLLKEASRWHRKGRMQQFPISSVFLNNTALRTRAALLNAQGRFKKAKTLWEKCLSLSETAVDVQSNALVFFDIGEAFLPRNPDIGICYLRHSWEIYKRLGCEWDLERLEKLVPELRVRVFTESIVPTRSAMSSSVVSGGVVMAERMETLVETAVQLSGILDLDDLFQRIVNDAARIFGAERAMLFLSEGTGGDYRRQAEFHSSGPQEENRPVPGAILTEVLTKGKTLISDDAQLDAQVNTSESVVSSGVHSFMAVPLKSQGRVVGGLYLDNRMLKGMFSSHDLKILEAFGAQAAVALENARLFARQERTQKDLKQLYDASRELMGVLDRRMIFSSLLGRARTLTGAAGAAIVLWEEGVAGVRLQQGFTPVQIKEIEQEARARKLEVTEERALGDGTAAVWAPLWVGDVLEGVLVVGGATDDRSKDLLTHLGTQCSLALHNARLYEMAITDEMTGVYQRRYYEMVLKNLVDRKTLFSLILIDMNDFKVINDTRGHAVGDAVLRGVGRAMRQTLRASDMAARIGGDEFAVVLMGETEENTKQVVEKLRTAISGIVVEDPGKEPPRVWASFGYAMSTEGGPAELKVTADQRLYEDKRRSKTGRTPNS